MPTLLVTGVGLTLGGSLLLLKARRNFQAATKGQKLDRDELSGERRYEKGRKPVRSAADQELELAEA